MVRWALALAAAIDRLNAGVGRAARWLVLGMLLIQLASVVLRYAFGSSYIFLSEAVLYLHAGLFMLGAGYTLFCDAHVRVDIVYSRLSSRGRALIDLLGTVVFLWPTTIAVGVFTFNFVANSWAVLEGPLSVGGIPAVFALKTLIPVFAGLIFLQGIAWAIRCALELTGHAHQDRAG